MGLNNPLERQVHPHTSAGLKLLDIKQVIKCMSHFPFLVNLRQIFPLQGYKED